MPAVEDVIDFRQPGWDQRINLGDGLFLLHWPVGAYAEDGREHWGFEHAHLYADGKARRVIAPFPDPDTHLIAPLLDAHDVTDHGDGRVTVSPSVLCDCGTHGFIGDSIWRSV